MKFSGPVVISVAYEEIRRYLGSGTLVNILSCGFCYRE